MAKASQEKKKEIRGKNKSNICGESSSITMVLAPSPNLWSVSRSVKEQERGRIMTHEGAEEESKGVGGGGALWFKSMILRHKNSHFPTSLGVSEVSERAQRSARAKGAGWSKRMSERCKRTRERTSEWPSTYVLNSG